MALVVKTMTSKSKPKHTLQDYLTQGLDLDDYNNLKFLNALTKEELIVWAQDLEPWQLEYAHSLIEIDILLQLDKRNTIGLAQKVLEPLMESAKKNGKPKTKPPFGPKQA